MALHSGARRAHRGVRILPELGILPSAHPLGAARAIAMVALLLLPALAAAITNDESWNATGTRA